jgi:hypothetical protein
MLHLTELSSPLISFPALHYFKMMVLEATQSLQCLKVKGFKATQSLLCCKNDGFGEKKSHYH